MKIHKIIALLTIIGTFTSCSNKMTTVVSNINTGIFVYKQNKAQCTTCPQSEIKIFPNKNVVYNGIENTQPIGLKTFTMSKKEYKAILCELEKSHFNYLATDYITKSRDLPVTEITYNGKSVRFQEEVKPEALNKINTLIQKIVIE